MSRLPLGYFKHILHQRELGGGASSYLVPGDGWLWFPLGATRQLHVGAHLYSHVTGNAGKYRGDCKARMRTRQQLDSCHEASEEQSPYSGQPRAPQLNWTQVLLAETKSSGALLENQVACAPSPTLMTSSQQFGV